MFHDQGDKFIACLNNVAQICVTAPTNNNNFTVSRSMQQIDLEVPIVQASDYIPMMLERFCLRKPMYGYLS